MPNEESWIAGRTADARKRNPLVPEAVSAGMQELLKGQLSERQLTQVELRSIAEALIKDLVPASPGAKAKE